MTEHLFHTTFLCQLKRVVELINGNICAGKQCQSNWENFRIQSPLIITGTERKLANREIKFWLSSNNLCSLGTICLNSSVWSPLTETIPTVLLNFKNEWPFTFFMQQYLHFLLIFSKETPLSSTFRIPMNTNLSWLHDSPSTKIATRLIFSLPCCMLQLDLEPLHTWAFSLSLAVCHNCKTRSLCLHFVWPCNSLVCLHSHYNYSTCFSHSLALPLWTFNAF